MSQYLISVIVPTYNRSNLLEYTLKSLVKQKMNKDLFEVVVADDGSSDDTKRIVDNYSRLLNVKYVFQEDLGYRVASARNLGVRACRGKICLFIDSGVMVDEHCLSHHIAFHEVNGENAAAIGYVYGFDENAELSKVLVDLIDPEDATKSIRVISKEKELNDVREEHYRFYNDNISDLPAPWLWFWTCHVSASRKNLYKVNLFDEAYDKRWGVEDNDLGFRLVCAGVKIKLLRDAKSIHFPHSKNKLERHQQGYENCLYFHEKFNTRETQVFLDSYMESEFVDINRLCIPELAGQAAKEDLLTVNSKPVMNNEV
jgi:glycosyltransferase involved in cell wall biosynthesis